MTADGAEFRKGDKKEEILAKQRERRAEAGKRRSRPKLSDEERRVRKLEYQREYHRKYYEAHKDKQAEYNHKYREAHKDECREYRRKYREAHKDERREYDRKYREAHKDELREYQRKYREAHKNKQAEYKRMCRQAINSARPKAQEREQEREPAKIKFVPYEFIKTNWQSKSV